MGARARSHTEIPSVSLCCPLLLVMHTPLRARAKVHIHSCIAIHTCTRAFSQVTPYEDTCVAVVFFFLATMLHAHAIIPFSCSKCSLHTICRVVLNYSEAGTGSAEVVFKILNGRIYLRSISLPPACWLVFTSFHLKP